MKTPEELIREHNEGCLAACGKTSTYAHVKESRRCDERRDCPECPKDWMIEWPPAGERVAPSAVERTTREEALAEALQLVLDDWANGNTILDDAQDKAHAALAMPKASTSSSATERTVKAVPFDDILSQIDHIQENGMNVAKFGGQDVDEGRCRQLCAMYLREFITSEDMRQRLIELDQRFEHEAQERCIAVYKDYSRDEIKAQPVSVQRVWMMGENASLNSVDGTASAKP